MIAALTAEDILHVSTRYLEFHTDPILLMDGSVPVLLTIHCNLYTGTLAMFAAGRPDVQAALDKALRFELLRVLLPHDQVIRCLHGTTVETTF